MLLGVLSKFLVAIHIVNAVFEGDRCIQGDAHKRGCVVCLCTMDNKWSCKRDICNDCEDREVQQKDNYNYYCANGKWTYVPFLQLPKEQVVLPFGSCKGDLFKPDWPCNRCKCSEENNLWECPLILCRDDIMLKSYSPKIHHNELDKLYEFFKYAGKKEICEEGETRDGDDCDNCECKDAVWWCKLKQCPEITETEDVIDADTLSEHPVIELPAGMEAIKEFKNQICDAGKEYQKNCNNCSCSADGMVEDCTQFDCEEPKSFDKKSYQYLYYDEAENYKNSYLEYEYDYSPYNEDIDIDEETTNNIWEEGERVRKKRPQRGRNN